LVLKKKGIGKKKKKYGTGKVGNWTKRPKKKVISEKSLVTTVPFIIEQPDEEKNENIKVEVGPEIKINQED